MTRAGEEITAAMLRLYDEAPSKGSVIERARISRATISWIRTGKQGPRISTLARILDAMGYRLLIVPKDAKEKPQP